MAKLRRLCWMAPIIVFLLCGSHAIAKRFAKKNTGYVISHNQQKFKRKDCHRANKHIFIQAIEEEAYFQDKKKEKSR